LARNFGVLLAAHGTLGQSALESLCMLAGPQEGIEPVGLFPGMGREEMRAVMEEKLQVLAGYKSVLIVADLAGGTPANVALELVAERVELQLVSGVNMAFLCELAAVKELNEETIAGLLEAGRNGLQDQGAKIRALLGQERGAAAFADNGNL
jgi:PTS system mannose-specific IIA component